MHNHPATIHRYAGELDGIIAGQRLKKIVSSSPEELHFQFDRFSWKVHFHKRDTFFLTPDADKFPFKNVLSQFSCLHGLKVKKVVSCFPDRRFQICFEKDKNLGFFLFGGRNGALAWNSKMEILDAFIFNAESVPDLSKTIDLIGTKDETLSKNLFIRDQLLEVMQQREVFDIQAHERKVAFDGIINEFTTSEICVDDNPPKLCFNFRSVSCEQKYDSILSAQDAFARKFLANFRFNQLFQGAQSILENRLKKQQKLFKSCETKLKKMTRPERYKELADILMANLHLNVKDVTSIELFDFYNNKPVKIDLKKNLNLQKNAEYFYRKAKNSIKEFRHQEKVQGKVESQILEIERLLEELNRIAEQQDFKALKTFHSTLDTSQKSQSASPDPYKKFNMDGFEIRVGKNAASNDKLLKLAGKHDIWLHARNTSGSHVIIRNPTQVNLPDHVLEYAASLAAGHSGNQHEGLAAVIHTPVKYVRKFKGANPGQVRVERETVILVKPKKV